MRYTWIDEYLLSKAGVTKDLQKDWNWIRYQVGGKMFVAVCLVWETDEPYYITLKLEPTEGAVTVSFCNSIDKIPICLSIFMISPLTTPMILYKTRQLYVMF
jgi:predicted DNA-binding protein (MmcQ/YjbR family)